MKALRVQVSNNGFLNYQEVGSGQPIIFVHGFGGLQQIWHLQVAFFAKHHFKVVTYDQRGHGASSPLGKSDGIELLAKDLLSLIDQLKLTHPVLVGHSMGASVICCLLHDYPRIRPKATVLVDQSPKMINDRNWPYGYCDATRANYRLVLKQHGNVRETLHGISPEVSWPLKTAKQQFPFDRTRASHLLLDHAKRDWRRTLAQTTIPTLLVTANQSPYFNGQFADELLKLNPDHLHHVSVDQSGHDIMAERPDIFNSVVLKFLSSLNRTLGAE